MIVEFTGCTSSGKSTYAQKTTEALCSLGVNAVSASYLLTQKFRLGIVKNTTIRNIFLDILLLPGTLFSLCKHSQFYIWGLKILFKKPDSYLGAINRIRSVTRKIAIYELLSKRNALNQIIIVDEGTVHSAHNLFVYSNCPLNQQHITEFANLVPLPDIIICLKVTMDTILHRIPERKDRRMRFESKTEVPKYISRAIEVFNALCRSVKLQSRLFPLLVADNDAKQDNPALSQIVSLIIDANNRLKSQSLHTHSDRPC